MKKVTTINFTSVTNRECSVTIERTYGYEKININADGDYFESKELSDRYTATVSIPSLNIENRDCYLTIINDGVKQGLNLNADYALVTTINHKSCYILLSKEDYEAMRTVCKERLTDDISSEDEMEINNIKAQEANGPLLPIAELKRLRAKYDQINNDGDEGYNPYLYCISMERATEMRNIYPERFN